jgi:hypothetical protein
MESEEWNWSGLTQHALGEEHEGKKEGKSMRADVKQGKKRAATK